MGNWHTGQLAYTENKNVACGDVGWFISGKQGTPFSFSVRPETLCQFTGLLDRNWDKIFEGDILQCEGVATKYTVVFEKCGFEIKRKSVCYGMLEHEHDQYDVIGNIHDEVTE